MRDRPYGWQQVHRWYDSMVGNQGSRYHTEIAIPKTIQLMGVKTGEQVIDIGCGQGVLAPHVKKSGGIYTGIDVSKSMIENARKRHGNDGTFLVGDAGSPKAIADLADLKEGAFDIAVFMLSIQDIKHHTSAISQAARLLNKTGRIVLFMTHPAFRIPRQSGWGYDKKRKLVYRRIDSYMRKLNVPLRTHHKTKQVLTRSFHRPLQNYIETLIKNKLYIRSFEEITEPAMPDSKENSAEARAREEIPLFLGIRADKTV